MTTGEKIMWARKKKGLTQKELADALCMSTATLSQYENDKVSPTIKTMEKIGKALEEEVQFLEKSVSYRGKNEINNERLRALKNELNLSDYEVADGTGIKRSLVFYHMASRRTIAAKDLVLYASFFNVSTDYLLGLTDARNNSRISAEDVAEDYTGLSKDVLEGLHSIKETIKKQKTILKDIKIVNALIRSIIKTDIEEI